MKNTTMRSDQQLLRSGFGNFDLLLLLLAAAAAQIPDEISP
jgi:hypothetical protein